MGILTIAATHCPQPLQGADGVMILVIITAAAYHPPPLLTGLVSHCHFSVFSSQIFPTSNAGCQLFWANLKPHLYLSLCIVPALNFLKILYARVATSSHVRLLTFSHLIIPDIGSGVIVSLTLSWVSSESSVLCRLMVGSFQKFPGH